MPPHGPDNFADCSTNLGHWLSTYTGYPIEASFVTELVLLGKFFKPNVIPHSERNLYKCLLFPCWPKENKQNPYTNTHPVAA